MTRVAWNLRDPAEVSEFRAVLIDIWSRLPPSGADLTQVSEDERQAVEGFVLFCAGNRPLATIQPAWVCATPKRGSQTMHWTERRIFKPSTHSALAVLIACLAFNLSLGEFVPNDSTEPLLLWACAHAVLGIALKEGRGLFR
jgi:hypothetical protein